MPFLTATVGCAATRALVKLNRSVPHQCHMAAGDRMQPVKNELQRELQRSTAGGREKAKQRRGLSSFTRRCGDCLYNRHWRLGNGQSSSGRTLGSETNNFGNEGRERLRVRYWILTHETRLARRHEPVDSCTAGFNVVLCGDCRLLCPGI